MVPGAGGNAECSPYFNSMIESRNQVGNAPGCSQEKNRTFRGGSWTHTVEKKDPGGGQNLGEPGRAGLDNLKGTFRKTK